MVEARWEDEVGHFWITHDVFQGRDGLLNPPLPPEATLVRDAKRPEHVKTNVQLDWQAPDVIARLDLANQYAGYLVFRRQGEEVKDWVRLTQSHDELTDLFTPDLLLLGEIQGDAPASPPLLRPVTILIGRRITHNFNTACKPRTCSDDAAKSHGQKTSMFLSFSNRHRSAISLPFT